MHHPKTTPLIVTVVTLLTPLTHAAFTEPLTTVPDLSLTLGFTAPTSETSAPSATGMITLPTESAPVGATSPALSLPTVPMLPSATDSLSGVASSSTAASASATGESGAAAGRGRCGASNVALLVALGMGVAGWVGL
ncbi:unnamed protein product [Discula destructiva]